MTIVAHAQHPQAAPEAPAPAVAIATADEAAIRGRALEQIGLLGSDREERFDRLTRLARQVFDVPIANITLLDGDRFWIKSTAGQEGVEGYPREDAFCDTPTRSREPLVVPDPTVDPRFAGFESVTGDMHVRFYAGIPITDPNNIVVGTFCLLDTEPREFSDAQLGILTELAGWARHEIVASGETQRAREVQQSLLPESAPDAPGYQVAGLCIPAQSVGGDFFDWAMIGDELGLTLSDVMGKGTGAAIISATVRSAVHSATRRHVRATNGGPAATNAILNDVGRALAPDLERTDTMVTLFLGALSTTTHVLRWCDAGHGLAVVVSADGDARWLSTRDLPLGVNADDVWHEHSLHLAEGDTLLVFSDGLLDLLGGDQDAMDAVVQLVATSRDVEDLSQQIRSFTQLGIAVDDVTAIAVQRRDA